MCRRFKIWCMVLIVVLAVFLSGCEKAAEEDGFQEVLTEEMDEEGTSGISGKNESLTNECIYVHVCGEVESPGVYELSSGSRIFEAIEAAGGVTKKASEEAVNQAEILKDGQQLYIPSQEELENQYSETGAAADGKVNINRASKEELMTLPGIGEAKADAIIRYRQEKGTFDSIENIMEIEGIKEGVFRKIQDQITVS